MSFKLQSEGKSKVGGQVCRVARTRCRWVRDTSEGDGSDVNTDWGGKSQKLGEQAGTDYQFATGQGERVEGRWCRGVCGR